MTDAVAEINVANVLGFYLPGLDGAALDDLARRAQEEFESRLRDGLADGMDAAEAEACRKALAEGAESTRRWLRKHGSDHRATAMTLTADLVAEVVRKVFASDPGAVDGPRTMACLQRNSLDLIGGYFRAEGANHQVDGGAVKLMFDLGDDCKALVRVWLDCEPKSLITIVGHIIDAEFPQDHMCRRAVFANDWNQRRFDPTAVLTMSDDDTWATRWRGYQFHRTLGDPRPDRGNNALRDDLND